MIDYKEQKVIVKTCKCLFVVLNMRQVYPKPACTCSESAIEIPEQCLKSTQS